MNKMSQDKKMENVISESQYVYHGSPEIFDVAIPKRQIRSKKDALGKQQVIFDQVSFHVTSFRWIALAYTYKSKQISTSEKAAYYTMGVDLYEYMLEITIYGTGSLEQSLAKLYGDGGYVLTFKREDFFHMQGLGNFELISTRNVQPVSRERIDKPVQQMLDAGVRFEFIDILKS